MRILKGLVYIIKAIVGAKLIHRQLTFLVILNQLGDKGSGICAALYQTSEGNAGTYEQAGNVHIYRAACHADHNEYP